MNNLQPSNAVSAIYVRLLNHQEGAENASSYRGALQQEIKNFAQEHTSRDSLEAAYISGFIGSREECQALLDTSDTLKNVFVFNEQTQVTLEVDLSVLMQDDLLELMANAGVNRLSVHIEFPKGIALQQSNSQYTIPGLTAAFANAARWFKDINLDVVIVDSQLKLTAYKSFMSHVVKWPLTHISLYIPNEVSIPEDVIADLFAWSSSWLRAHEFGHYEFSHFARPGFESRSNVAAWDRKSYKGFGIKACSFDGITRTRNEGDVARYVELINTGADLVQERETLNAEQTHLEKLMLGLRRLRGVSIQSLLEDLSQEKQEKFKEVVGLLVQHKFLREYQGRLALTQAGMLVENKVISALLV